MNDRELLELAAKAAGLRLTWGEKYKVGNDEVDCTDLPYALGDSPDEARSYWNPLADDGDALRLAVTLGLDVRVSLHAKETHVYGPHGFAGEVHNDDTCAATRRAIVRAAAESGEGMETK